MSVTYKHVGSASDGESTANYMTTSDEITARLERIPVSRWHSKARLLLGVATFFDAFDALVIAQVLPVLIPLWGLSGEQVGTLIASGYLGQLIGAVFFGWLAGKIGRLWAIIIATAIFSTMSIFCGLADSFSSLLIFRFVQGIGLGGEVPVAAVYISEIIKAQHRGRFVLLYELIFTIGVFVCGFVGTIVVPHLGWQWMFFIGAIPIILVPTLKLFLPESPRWLVSHERFQAANKAMRYIENKVQKSIGSELPPVMPVSVRTAAEGKSSWRDYFSAFYGRRTFVLWLIWFASYLVYYGLGTWMPTLYTTLFHLPIAQSLNYALITNFCGVLAALTCVLTVDLIGRKTIFTIAFLGSFAAFALLYLAGVSNLVFFVTVISACYYFGTLAAFCIYIYTPECYPTRARTQGMGMASAWCRVASILGPYFIGAVVHTGLNNVFLTFGAVCIFVAIIVIFLAPETKGRVLEEVSP